MSLKREAIASAGWNGIGNIARQALQIITLVVLARLLSPDDFGLYAVLMVIVAFTNLLGNMGTTSVIIHSENPSQNLLSSVFFLNIAIGFSLCLGLFFLSNSLAVFFNEEDSGHLFKLVSISFFVTSFSFVQKALLEKAMNFEKLVKVEFVAQLIGVIVGVSLAVYGVGIYSLIVMMLINSFFLTVGLWFISRWRPSIYFSLSKIKEIWLYTSSLTGFNIINFFGRNSDTFIIGKFLGATELGTYNLAYRIMLYPIQNVSTVLIRVLFPAFSKIKDDQDRLKRGYLNALSYIAMITFPIMMGLVGISDTFVMALLGEKWEKVSVLLLILAPIGMIQSIITPSGSIFAAKGTTPLLFKLGLANTAITVVAFLIGVNFGVEGVSLGYAIANLIMLYPNLHLAWRQIDLSVSEGLMILFPFLSVSGVMGVLVYALGLWLDATHLSIYSQLAIQIFTGVFLYTGLMFVFFKERSVAMVSYILPKYK
jgi:PST family polysaccharide transporter